jgi:hypothetical protein
MEIYHLAPLVRWTVSSVMTKIIYGSFLITRETICLQEADDEYFPPTYEKDGFVHATREPERLLGIANHFYK